VTNRQAALPLRRQRMTRIGGHAPGRLNRGVLIEAIGRFARHGLRYADPELPRRPAIPQGSAHTQERRPLPTACVMAELADACECVGSQPALAGSSAQQSLELALALALSPSSGADAALLWAATDAPALSLQRAVRQAIVLAGRRAEDATLRRFASATGKLAEALARLSREGMRRAPEMRERRDKARFERERVARARTLRSELGDASHPVALALDLEDDDDIDDEDTDEGAGGGLDRGHAKAPAAATLGFAIMGVGGTAATGASGLLGDAPKLHGGGVLAGAPVVAPPVPAADPGAAAARAWRGMAEAAAAAAADHPALAAGMSAAASSVCLLPFGHALAGPAVGAALRRSPGPKWDAPQRLIARAAEAAAEALRATDGPAGGGDATTGAEAWARRSPGFAAEATAAAATGRAAGASAQAAVSLLRRCLPRAVAAAVAAAASDAVPEHGPPGAASAALVIFRAWPPSLDLAASRWPPALDDVAALTALTRALVGPASPLAARRGAASPHPVLDPTAPVGPEWYGVVVLALLALGRAVAADVPSREGLARVRAALGPAGILALPSLALSLARTSPAGWAVEPAPHRFALALEVAAVDCLWRVRRQVLASEPPPLILGPELWRPLVGILAGRWPSDPTSRQAREVLCELSEVVGGAPATGAEGADAAAGGAGAAAGDSDDRSAPAASAPGRRGGPPRRPKQAGGAPAPPDLTPWAEAVRRHASSAACVATLSRVLRLVLRPARRGRAGAHPPPAPERAAEAAALLLAAAAAVANAAPAAAAEASLAVGELCRVTSTTAVLEAAEPLRSLLSAARGCLSHASAASRAALLRARPVAVLWGSRRDVAEAMTAAADAAEAASQAAASLLRLLLLPRADRGSGRDLGRAASRAAGGPDGTSRPLIAWPDAAGRAMTLPDGLVRLLPLAARLRALGRMHVASAAAVGEPRPRGRGAWLAGEAVAATADVLWALLQSNGGRACLEAAAAGGKGSSRWGAMVRFLAAAADFLYPSDAAEALAHSPSASRWALELVGLPRPKWADLLCLVAPPPAVILDPGDDAGDAAGGAAGCGVADDAAAPDAGGAEGPGAGAAAEEWSSSSSPLWAAWSAEAEGLLAAARLPWEWSTSDLVRRLEGRPVPRRARRRGRRADGKMGRLAAEPAPGPAGAEPTARVLGGATGPSAGALFLEAGWEEALRCLATDASVADEWGGLAERSTAQRACCDCFRPAPTAVGLVGSGSRVRDLVDETGPASRRAVLRLRSSVPRVEGDAEPSPWPLYRPPPRFLLPRFCCCSLPTCRPGPAAGTRPGPPLAPVSQLEVPWSLRRVAMPGSVLTLLLALLAALLAAAVASDRAA